MDADHDADPRADRILEAAMELAEADGYDAVRLRDVASRADVALGTVYRRFHGKEDILAALLERMVVNFHDAVRVAPVPGKTPIERLGAFLAIATQALAERPKLAAAILRTVASGDAAASSRILAYKDTFDQIVVIVTRGRVDEAPPTGAEALVARLVRNTWFAEMVGWTGGLQSVEEALEHVLAVTTVFLEGLDHVDPERLLEA